MTKRLLDRQAELLGYLTSSKAIFGDQGGTALPRSLQGINSRMLGLEARFSHRKRMDKIVAVFPETFRLLGTASEAITHEFTCSCPPLDIGRLENARQFHDFLVSLWQQTQPAPPYLPDVAAFEFTCALVRVQQNSAPDPTTPFAGSHAAIRRSRSIVLLQTRFDIRGLFWDQNMLRQAPDDHPPERQTCLAFQSKSGTPAIFELTPEVFALLGALDEWTALDDVPGADELAAELADAGMLELRP